LIFRLNNWYRIILAFTWAFINYVIALNFLTTTIHKWFQRLFVHITPFMRWLFLLILIINHAHELCLSFKCFYGYLCYLCKIFLL
jgi:hypothetical protein